MHTRAGMQVHIRVRMQANDSSIEGAPLTKSLGSLNNVLLMKSALRHVTPQHRLHLSHLRTPPFPLRLTTSTTSHHHAPFHFPLPFT